MWFYCFSTLNACYLLAKEGYWKSSRKCSTTETHAMKRGIGRSLLFTLRGQWLEVIWSVAFFPLLFFKSTSRQAAGRGCGGRSRPRGKRGSRRQRQPPSAPNACCLVHALTCGFALCLLARVRTARIQKSTPDNFFMRSESHRRHKGEKLRAKDNAAPNRTGKCTATQLRLVFLIRNDRHKTSLWIFIWSAFEQP